MNEFHEHTWSAAQRTLDGQLAQRFEGLEAAQSLAPDAFLTEQAEALNAFAADVAGIEHEARRAHWLTELNRLGWTLPDHLVVPPPGPAVIDDEPIVVVADDEPVVEVEEPTVTHRGGKRRG